MPKTNTTTNTKAKTDTKKPDFYHVILLNDDYTSMDFVVSVLIKLFHQNIDQAHKIMMEVHQQERAIAGTYSKEIAIEKMQQTHELAISNQFPLRCTIEKA